MSTLLQYVYFFLIGFWHEQARLDAGHYIQVHCDNVASGGLSNFDPCRLCTDQGHPYDCKSIMHYGRFSAAIDSSIPTISAIPGKCNDDDLTNDKTELSYWDVRDINKMYECKRGTLLFIPSTEVIKYTFEKSYKCLPF